MKKLISVLLVISMLFSLAVSMTFSGNADGYRYGDLNDDGKVTAVDSLLMRKYLAGYSVTINVLAADINCDETVDNQDMFMLRQHAAKMIEISPIPVTDTYLSSIAINGTDMRKYQIVIPENCDVFTTYAADLLADYVFDKSGIQVPVVNDTTDASQYEILIGDTSRPESISAKNAVTCASDEYLLKLDGKKLVMQGESYMVAAGVGTFTYDYISYDVSKISQICNITNLPTANAAKKYTPKAAKSAILMIGDGMGLNHATATLYYNRYGTVEPGYTEFSATRLPYFATVTTGSLDTLKNALTATDSAAAGTALACGQKTDNHKLGLSSSGRVLVNIREVAESLGKRTGIMATEFAQGATPAAFTVHYTERNYYDNIAALQAQITDMEWFVCDVNDSLLPKTIEALDVLSTNNEEGFFTMIEESNIDTWSHQQDKKLTTHVMARFNSAVQYAMAFTVAHPDTLLIITADHETGAPSTTLTFGTNSHTTNQVPLYAIGQGAEKFTGSVDNTYVPKVIAANWGVTLPK